MLDPSTSEQLTFEELFGAEEHTSTTHTQLDADIPIPKATEFQPEMQASNEENLLSLEVLFGEETTEEVINLNTLLEIS